MTNKITYPEDLPITGSKDEIIAAILEHPVVIIAGETGSGKTTQLPKMCLEAGLGKKRLIGCTQPRRLAAVSIAARVASELGKKNRHLIGYKIRFKDRTTGSTKIKFMTDGILLAEAQMDRSLRAYDTVIVDEAHERNLNIDFLLGIFKQLLWRRKDLKLIITSATIDTEKFSKKFDNAPVIEVCGRTYPIDVVYRHIPEKNDPDIDESYVDEAINAVLDIMKTDHVGDILIFMPTERDILETVEGITNSLKGLSVHSASQNLKNTLVIPLFGRQSGHDQNRIYRPFKGQKIVVATNVAETSITVPGIRYVVDTGLARISIYNVRARTSKLPIRPISRAACDQRKGRCGRVGPGVCIRLYKEEDYLKRPEHTTPEIQRSDLAEVILRMRSLSLGDPVKFPFIDPPSPRAIKDGFNLLTELGAINLKKNLTKTGRLLARLPLDPRISRMIVEARDNNALREVTIIGAALSIRDPRVRPAGKEAEADKAHARFKTDSSDFLTYLKIWDTFHATLKKVGSKSKIRKFCKTHYLSYQRMREWKDIHEHILLILDREGGFDLNRESADYESVHKSLLSGNLRNIALKREKNIYQGGRLKELMVFPGSDQFGKSGKWIMAAELVETSRLYARTVASIKPEWIEPLARGLCRSSYSDPHWEKKRGQVIAKEKVTLFSLVIISNRKVNYGRIKPDEARQIFIQTALIEFEINGRYEFLEHNKKIITGLEELEKRVRRRDILVDEYQLQLFYENRLPPDLFDQAGLNRFLKKKHNHDLLKMSEADILNRAPDEKQLSDFPKTLRVHDTLLKLSYSFEPGKEEDGVSLLIPMDLAPHLDPEFFEWLVPGLLKEKVAFMLKGLPKSVRKHLVPISQTTKKLLAELVPYQDSLYQGLERAILRNFQIRITRSQWSDDSLPDHYKMRYCLVDESENIVRASRNLRELTGSTPSKAFTSQLAELKKKWEREEVLSWNFKDLPERIPVHAADRSLKGFVFPGLAANDNKTISVRLFTSERDARAATRQGLLVLYGIKFEKELKGLKRIHLLPSHLWALYEGIDSHGQVNRDVIIFLQEEIFSTRNGVIPSEEKFLTRVSKIKERGLVPEINKLADLVLTVLKQRRETLDQVTKFESITQKTKGNLERFKEYRRQIDLIIPPDFLKEFDSGRLSHAVRYFKALRIRIERAHVAPAKDEARAAQVAPHEARLKSLKEINEISPKQEKEIEEYRQMIEEFKVSLFAQEIKTAFPVSAKRLEKKWEELRND